MNEIKQAIAQPEGLCDDRKLFLNGTDTETSFSIISPQWMLPWPHFGRSAVYMRVCEKEIDALW